MTVTFDLPHTGPDAALSSADRVCAPGNAQNGTRVTVGYNAAGGLALYWEFKCISTSAFGANFPWIGLSPSTDTFDGNGLNGYVATMLSGYAAGDNGIGAPVGAHNGVIAALGAYSNFAGAGAIGTAIGCVWDATAGTLDVYSINTLGTIRTFCYRITAPTSGTWMPSYGTGFNAPVLESYQWNGSDAQFLMAKPGGTVAYEAALLVAPVSDFSGTPLSGAAPLSVPFTDASLNAPDTWAWDFGDGATSALQNPTHVFAPGVYAISLTVTNGAGSSTKTIPNYIVSSVAPVAGLPTLMSQAPISAVLLGITAGVRCGAAAGGGDGYAVISPLMRAVTVVSLAMPGVPAIMGTVTLPLSPETISVDTSDGLTLYVYGQKTLWIITLASLVPTLAATHDMPASGGGGVDVYSLPGGVYQGTIGPFLRGGRSVSNDTTTFVHDQDRQLLYIYTRSGSSPYLTLNDRVPTSNIQGIRSMRLGVVATMGGSTARLFIVTAHYLYTFALDGTLLLTTRNDDSVLNDYLAVLDPISAAYKAHLAGSPYVEGQDGAPLYGVEEDFLGALDNAGGTIVVSANAKLGRLTVWQ